MRSERVNLRELEINDANGGYPGWLNDPEVCKYNSHGDASYTKEMAIEYIKSVQISTTCKVFAICTVYSNLHIGNISLQQINHKNKSAEFAILVGNKDYWGKGFSKEAGKLIFDYGFNILKLHRIYCGTNKENILMQKLAIALGMKEEGCKKEALFKNGNFYDVLRYAITRL